MSRICSPMSRIYNPWRFQHSVIFFCQAMAPVVADLQYFVSRCRLLIIPNSAAQSFWLWDTLFFDGAHNGAHIYSLSIYFAIYLTMTKKWYRPFRAELERLVFLHRASLYAGGCRYFVAATLKKNAGCTQDCKSAPSRCRGFIIRDVFNIALFISMALICILWPPHFAIYLTMTKKWYRPFRAELERLVFLHRASPYADRFRYFVAATFKKLLAVRRSFCTCVSRCRGFIIRDVFYSALFISMALICILWPHHFAIYPMMNKKWYRPFRAELERLVFLHRASPYAGGCRYFVAATFKKLLVVLRSLFTCVSRCRGFIIRDVFYSALFISMALICILWPPHCAIYLTMTKKWYRPFRTELERIVFLHRASPYAGGCRYFVAATFKKLLCT